jgi:hypothetical protein
LIEVNLIVNPSRKSTPGSKGPKIKKIISETKIILFALAKNYRTKCYETVCLPDGRMALFSQRRYTFRPKDFMPVG